MHINNIKEQYSLAYIKAIASVANFEYAIPNVDDKSVDIVVWSGDYNGYEIDIQLKSTSNLEYIKDNFIHFPLKLKNYNDLKEKYKLRTNILVCLIIPKEDNPIDWINQTERSLELMKCAYWINLKGYEETENSNSVTINIPMNQMFTPKALNNIAKENFEELMEKLIK